MVALYILLSIQLAAKSQYDTSVEVFLMNASWDIEV